MKLVWLTHVTSFSHSSVAPSCLQHGLQPGPELRVDPLYEGHGHVGPLPLHPYLHGIHSEMWCAANLPLHFVFYDYGYKY